MNLRIRSYRGCYWYVANGKRQVSHPCRSRAEALLARRQIEGGCGYV